MKHCKYCASTNTRLDEMGYCKKYRCFEQSGEQIILNRLIERAHNIYMLPTSATLSIRSYVSNYYNPRDREANLILDDAQRLFGMVPSALLEVIPAKHMKKWDRNIRW